MGCNAFRSLFFCEVIAGKRRVDRMPSPCLVEPFNREAARHRILAGIARPASEELSRSIRDRAGLIFTPLSHFGISGNKCSGLPFGRAGSSLGTSHR